MRRLVAVDGPPGVGKTTTIIRRAESGELDAVVTYGRDAALVLNDRAPEIVAGTIYSLAYGLGAKQTAQAVKFGGARGRAPHTDRAISSAADPALGRYVREAPSRRDKDKRQDKREAAIHRYDGTGDPPFDFGEEDYALRFQLALARWLQAGAPWSPDFRGFRTIALDEAQDFSALELAAALALLRPDGVAYAYGDPGQAIHLGSKGVPARDLPPAFALADETQLLTGGHRCGNPLAAAASAVLASYWPRDASAFAAPHNTEILPWSPTLRPQSGLVLALPRRTVERKIKEWGARNIWVIPNKTDCARELAFSTIHSAKGSESPDVYVLPNRRLCDKIQRRDPEALKVLYVAMTRARHRLYLPRSLKAILPK